jgi:hypothetical protein
VTRRTCLFRLVRRWLRPLVSCLTYTLVFDCIDAYGCLYRFVKQWVRGCPTGPSEFLIGDCRTRSCWVVEDGCRWFAHSIIRMLWFLLRSCVARNASQSNASTSNHPPQGVELRLVSSRASTHTGHRVKVEVHCPTGLDDTASALRARRELKNWLKVYKKSF